MQGRPRLGGRREGESRHTVVVDRSHRATWDLLRELRSSGVSVVLTTHAMDEAEALADQVWMIDRGRVAASGTVGELTADGESLEDVFLTRTHGVVG